MSETIVFSVLNYGVLRGTPGQKRKRRSPMSIIKTRHIKLQYGIYLKTRGTTLSSPQSPKAVTFHMWGRKCKSEGHGGSAFLGHDDR
ncbi:hypothetical protein STEG23_011208, partial [Scotinomys teguina]